MAHAEPQTAEWIGRRTRRIGGTMPARKNRTTRTAAIVAMVCDIIRPTARGDWFATLPIAAFDAAGVDIDAGYVARADDTTARVRFGGRAGAMIAAVPDDRRAAIVVASVVAFRAHMADGYATFARAGAIDSPAVAAGSRIAPDRTGGSAVRDAIGRYPASRRVAMAPGVADAAADKFGTDASAFHADA